MKTSRLLVQFDQNPLLREFYRRLVNFVTRKTSMSGQMFILAVTCFRKRQSWLTKSISVVEEEAEFVNYEQRSRIRYRHRNSNFRYETRCIELKVDCFALQSQCTDSLPFPRSVTWFNSHPWYQTVPLCQACRITSRCTVPHSRALWASSIRTSRPSTIRTSSFLMRRLVMFHQ